MILMGYILERISFTAQQQINTISSGEVIVSEKLDSIDYGPAIVEHMDDSIARDLLLRSNLDVDLKEDNRNHGIWVVPSRDASYYTHSGEHNVIRWVLLSRPMLIFMVHGLLVRVEVKVYGQVVSVQSAIVMVNISKLLTGLRILIIHPLGFQ